jgi:hypothetical protein
MDYTYPGTGDCMKFKLKCTKCGEKVDFNALRVNTDTFESECIECVPVIKEDGKVSDEFIFNIIICFLAGLNWKPMPNADLIYDPGCRVWCRWKDVKKFRKIIVNNFKRSEKVKLLAIELEKWFKEVAKISKELRHE